MLDLQLFTLMFLNKYYVNLSFSCYLLISRWEWLYAKFLLPRFLNHFLILWPKLTFLITVRLSLPAVLSFSKWVGQTKHLACC